MVHSFSITVCLVRTSQPSVCKPAVTLSIEKQRVHLSVVYHRRVAADTTSLAHGTFGVVPATLLALRFRFSYEPVSSARLTHAETHLRVYGALNFEQAGPPPGIVLFAPACIHLPSRPRISTPR